jgi:hypothetical protein
MVTVKAWLRRNCDQLKIVLCYFPFTRPKPLATFLASDLRPVFDYRFHVILLRHQRRLYVPARHNGKLVLHVVR